MRQIQRPRRLRISKADLFFLYCRNLGVERLTCTAEALALQKGLELLERVGCQNVVIESDSSELILAYNGTVEV
jgi:hypothetical protein